MRGLFEAAKCEIEIMTWNETLLSLCFVCVFSKSQVLMTAERQDAPSFVYAPPHV
jgi:hypothetical protein